MTVGACVSTVPESLYPTNTVQNTGILRFRYLFATQLTDIKRDSVLKSETLE